MADTRTRPGTDRRPLMSYLRVQADHERQMLRILQASSVRIDSELKRLTARSGIGAAVRRDQLAASQAAMHREMRTLWQRVGDHVEAGRAEAAAAAVESTYPLSALKSVLPAADVDYLLRSAQETARRGAQTVETRQRLSQRPLAASVYANETHANGKIDGIINDALARGASAAELAKDVRQYIRPDVKGGVSYAANRLGRTELNNAFHAQQVEQGIKEPWTHGMLWNLSGSHPRPDTCNEYADDQHYNGGDAGVFKPEDVPEKPHPNCLCFTTPVTDDRDEFIRKFQTGQYDAHIDEIMDEGSMTFGGPSGAIVKPPALPPQSSVLRSGSPGLQSSLRTAEAQRNALGEARYIAKGKGKGNLNPANGYNSATAGARQNYSESLNSEMNLLKRDPKQFAANWKGDDDWIAHVAEQNRLLEELLSKNAITQEIHVARAMTGDFSNLKAGEFMADPGFLSTTTDIKEFLDYPSMAFEARVAAGEQPWTFIIRAPAGTNALPGAHYQKEIFFGPGTKQRILEVDAENHTIYTEIVG